MKKKYNLWVADEGCMHALLENGDSNGESNLPDEAEVSMTFEADNWEDAQNQMRKALGMEPYRSMPDDDVSGI